MQYPFQDASVKVAGGSVSAMWGGEEIGKMSRADAKTSDPLTNIQSPGSVPATLHGDIEQHATMHEFLCARHAQITARLPQLLCR
jgi:hypothetical protein